MNESNFINPKTCRTCGRCCETFTIMYPKELDIKGGDTLLSEVDRFRLLDTGLIEIIDYPSARGVKLNIKCKHLSHEKGIFTCNIYDSPERPLLCQRYPGPDSEDCPYKMD